MCDEWIQTVTLPITLEEFHQLPRHPAYKYEYWDKHAHLTPRPKFYHALLDMEGFQAPEHLSAVTVRLLEDCDFPQLEGIFAAAFHCQQPFSSLSDEQRLQAARQSLEKVRAAEDGPLMPQASFVAIENERLIGAILVTLLPDEDPDEWDSYRWLKPPPTDWLQNQLGRPHITWIFVGPWHAGGGVGTSLLAGSVAVLRAMGYKRLASTFLLGNDSSMLWHWRNGFQLQSFPGSRRRMRRLFNEWQARVPE